MRRAHGHLAFCVAATAFGLLTLAQGLRLRHADRVNAAIAESTASTVAEPTASGHAGPTASRPTESTTSGTAESTASRATESTALRHAQPPASRGTDVIPEARLARAVALSKVDYDGALAAYKAIIQGNSGDLRQTALYDLGNLHLRQALKSDREDEAQSLPLTELAKQSYRDALRKDPMDWDARYNLERALRVAPEEDEDSGEDTGPPDPKEHQRSTLADPRMDLP